MQTLHTTSPSCTNRRLDGLTRHACAPPPRALRELLSSLALSYTGRERCPCIVGVSDVPAQAEVLQARHAARGRGGSRAAKACLTIRIDGEEVAAVMPLSLLRKPASDWWHVTDGGKVIGAVIAFEPRR
jgi:hypothetical protein